MTVSYRKVGGIHWFKIGRWRISICRARRGEPVPVGLLPIDLATLRPLLHRHSMAALYADRVAA